MSDKGQECVRNVRWEVGTACVGGRHTYTHAHTRARNEAERRDKRRRSGGVGPSPVESGRVTLGGTVQPTRGTGKKGEGGRVTY